MAQLPSTPRPPATLRDVAAAAGVSVATASRVLSGNPATSSTSRQAVTAAAAQLDFHPNVQARALRSSRTASIGLLIPDIRNPHFGDLAHSVEMHARERGLVTLISASDERLDTQETALRLLMSHNVDGLIVVPQGRRDSPRGPEALDAVVQRGIPLVLADRMVSGLDVPAVVPGTNGLTDAVNELLALGHERIALIAGPATSSTGRERRLAFDAALDAAGATPDPDLVHEGDFQPASGREGVARLLGLPPGRRPSAVVIADGPMAVGALAALNERGVRIPQDLSVVAHDDLDAFRLCDPPVSAIAQDIAAMGAVALNLLLEPPADGEERTVRQPTLFIQRGSVAEAGLQKSTTTMEGGDDS
ncbi:LacI family transcriptional regulator [Kocuria varians]